LKNLSSFFFILLHDTEVRTKNQPKNVFLIKLQ